MGKLSIDYSDDWQLVDGVEDAGFEFSPQREFDGTPPTAPDDGVKVRRCNPTKSDIMHAGAQGVGLESTDITFSLWSTTLRSGSELISPARGDFILVDDGDYRILTCTRTMDYAQWRCVCRRRASQTPI